MKIIDENKNEDRQKKIFDPIKFTDFYENMAQLYFLSEPARRRSRAFYQTMYDLIKQQDLVKVETAVRTMMQESIDLWPGREKKHFS